MLSKVFLLQACIGTCLLCLFMLGMVSGQCPHQKTGLVNFSSLVGWNVANSDILITKAVKLNDSPPNKLRSITIKSGGSLIFDNVNLNLDLNFIRVEQNASFIMGSSSCPITSKIVMTFYGDRVNSSVNDMGSDPFDGSNLGSKGIAFLSGSIVQIFGKIDGPSWTEIVKNATKGSNQLVLRDSVAWKVGDSIVIASTDYGEVYDYRTQKETSLNWAIGEPFPNQNEERKIVQLLNGNKTIVLDVPLNYTHFASDNGKIRAEDLIMNYSSETSLFGGHFIIRLVDKFNMEGVEITRFGQQGLMGRYSFHFHLLQSKPAGLNFTVKDNSVHHSYQRCYVVHDTHYILLQNNVCYRAYGHMYFLEDGSEYGNQFISNLGIDPIPISKENSKRLIPSDTSVSVFWITNPNNTFIGNHAVGGRFPFWFSLPSFPTGLSALRYPAGSVNPRTAPTKPFEYNVAHSSNGNGLHIDDFEKADGNSEIVAFYTNNAVYSNFVSYKNRVFGVWCRGGYLRFDNLYLTDNKIAMNAPVGATLTEDSIFIGESENVGEYSYRPTVDLGKRTRPALYSSTLLDIIKGYEHYDIGGPQYLNNITFINFVTDSYKYAGALSSRAANFKLQTKNKFSNLKFINSNRYFAFPYTYPTSYDNMKGIAMMDMDGTTTNITSFGGWIVGNETIRNFPQCQLRNDWNAYQCPFFGESYSHLRITTWNWPTLNTTGKDGVKRPELADYTKPGTRMYLVDLLRNRQADLTGAYLTGPMDYYLQNNVINRGFYGLRWPYDIPTPKNFSIALDSSATNDWLVLAIQYPRNSNFSIKYSTNSNKMVAASNFTTMFKDPTNYYYYDGSTEHLYVKLQNQASRTSYKLYDIFVDYSSSGGISLNATCPNDNCAPSQFSNPKNPGATYKALMREDRFVGRLETCQQSNIQPLASGSTVGGGLVFAFLDTEAASLDFTVPHSLSSIVTSLDVGFGQPGKEDYIATPTSKTVPYSQSRFGYKLSYEEWNYLLQGKMFVKLSTSENPNGHLRAQLYLSNGTSTSCNLPPLVSSVKPCDSPNVKNSSHVISIYNEASALSGEWSLTAYSPTDVRNSFFNVSYSPAICGNTSLHFGLRKGDISFNKIGPKLFVDTSIYKYFELFIKTANPIYSIQSIGFVFSYYNNSKLVEAGRYVATTSNFQHLYKIDGNRATRVRIPVSSLSFDPVQLIQRITIYLVDQTNYVEFLVDNMRFVGMEGKTETTERTMTISQCKNYGSVSSCGSLVNPDPDPLGIRNL
ncbi:hypothetical protein NAEGRDRAFT_66848 [Naegleria gruberi]|uniref:G8 domain-containing protein n=1 Tax=Naegleria gruberi TaxID=5762 RepID=D2VDH7_NAEGR|nr:uncharacterized protein NAEGRDRAFT_66848 [Naegleria gruberi]EFC45237.1 hypothetical protein NAEGRDRAFT_66848 [Naegleria gruberi]|eukprot:XP_002677981.1 hypothetical protein NAEGRDRAFT_66848 [Naegleria gruberi strain NEG-M]